MANWYCDYTNGNDSTGSGTSGSPYKTLDKCISVASGGDDIFVANTSAQLLTTSVSWVGFTANSNYLNIRAWNNGGSITIQHPNESSPRVGAVLDGNNVATFLFSASSQPAKVRIYDFRFINNNIGGNPYMTYSASADWAFIGCEWEAGSANAQYHYSDGFTSFADCYFHGSVNASQSLIRTADNFSFKNCWIEGETNTNTRMYIDFGAGGEFDNCILKMKGAGRGLNLNSTYIFIDNCTLVGDGSANQTGIYSASANNSSVTNTLFYKFNGSGSKGEDINIFARLFAYGNNAYYDCNASTITGGLLATLTDRNITESGNPFVDSANDDYSVTGSTAENAGLGTNMNIGAIQETSSGGGGGSATVAYAYMG